MKRKTIWPDHDLDKGVASAFLRTWTQFHDVVGKFLDLPHYVFRGQRKSDWLLESTLTRKLKKRVYPPAVVDDHLNHFKYAIRGRRGPNPLHADDDGELWALGQHHGLATPLLDWTSSPYVALFFAYARSKSDDTEYRILFGLNIERVSEVNGHLAEDNDPFSDSAIEIVNPLSDENARLICQAGLFTKLPYAQDLESWVTSNYSKIAQPKVLLMKLCLPNRDREACLKALNRMNINFATLFPDLEGASEHCSLMLEIPNYCAPLPCALNVSDDQRTP